MFGSSCSATRVKECLWAFTFHEMEADRCWHSLRFIYSHTHTVKSVQLEWESHSESSCGPAPTDWIQTVYWEQGYSTINLFLKVKNILSLPCLHLYMYSCFKLFVQSFLLLFLNRYLLRACHFDISTECLTPHDLCSHLTLLHQIILNPDWHTSLLLLLQESLTILQ